MATETLAELISRLAETCARVDSLADGSRISERDRELAETWGELEGCFQQVAECADQALVRLERLRSAAEGNLSKATCDEYKAATVALAEATRGLLLPNDTIAPIVSRWKGTEKSLGILAALASHTPSGDSPTDGRADRASARYRRLADRLRSREWSASYTDATGRHIEKSLLLAVLLSRQTKVARLLCQRRRGSGSSADCEG